MIEAYTLSDVVEQGLQTRAIVFDMKGQLIKYSSDDWPASSEAIHLGQPRCP